MGSSRTLMRVQFDLSTALHRQHQKVKWPCCRNSRDLIAAVKSRQPASLSGSQREERMVGEMPRGEHKRMLEYLMIAQAYGNPSRMRYQRPLGPDAGEVECRPLTTYPNMQVGK